MQLHPNDLFPALLGLGSTVKVLVVTPSLGVNGFVLGVVVRVGYRPTDSSPKAQAQTRHQSKHWEKHKAMEELKHNQKQKH
ncbi:MAG: hypothetical protein AT713_05840 [Caldivirga sp. JCHS_4]|nr:MAG: hypothetical protein AT713_05840 [Caldivirga sp. JCHS_4]